MPEPGELPLGVMAGVGAADLGRFLQARSRPARCRISAGTPCAFIAGSSGSSCRAASAATSSSAPAVQHRVEARIDPRIELVAVGREEQRAELRRRQQRRQAVAMPVGQRARRSPRPPRARGRCGCDRAASGVRPMPDRAAPVRHAAPRRRRAPAARARRRAPRRDRRHRRQPARQRLEIQPGAADEDRQAVLRARFRQHRSPHRPASCRPRNSPRHRHGRRAGAAPAPPPPASAAP